MSFGSILSLVSTTGLAEVHLLGDSTIIFASCDSVRVKCSFETECLSRVDFLYLGEGTGHVIVLEHHQTSHKLVI